MRIVNIKGIPDFECIEYAPRQHNYVVIIPIINEGNRIHEELKRSYISEIFNIADIVICDGGSTDDCTNESVLKSFNVNSLLIKEGDGKQGAQLRMGFYFARERGYKGIITIDGNNKDSIEDVPFFIKKIEEGYDFIQGSRFVRDGRAINTPFFRLISVRLIHAPIISLTARKHFTDTTNAFRAYSAQYLFDERTSVFRDIFTGYELLAYLSVRATQLGYKACEVPVTRAYPKNGKTPTKISFYGNFNLLIILLKNLFGKYKPNSKNE